MLRPHGHTLNSYHEYCNHPTVFTLKVNHGVVTMVKELSYVNQDVETTLNSYHEYCNHPTVFTLKVNHGEYFDSNLDNGIKPLSFDYDVMDMAKYVNTNTETSQSIHKDIASGSNVSKTNCTRKDKASGPNASKKPIVIEENDRSHSNVASDDSKENDLDVDQKDRIDDVEVDMADFRKYTDENVEWVGCNEEEVEIPQTICR
uniref:Uncharacterized protein n=1 Tax=Tanacetum cinerariifolium TaxID=118510 RepID=A0A6L2N9M5_TANCI|nr:hypothetical protein [Tanacetum cinerariifolium]